MVRLSGELQVTKGAVTIKLWDLGGQPRFRSMWERYCRGVNAILYVVDSSDHESVEVFIFLFLPCSGNSLLKMIPLLFQVAMNELHDLMTKPMLANIPLLVLGNKNDLPSALTVDELIERMYFACSQTRVTFICRNA